MSETRSGPADRPRLTEDVETPTRFSVQDGPAVALHLVVLGILPVLLTWPLALSLASAVPGTGPGDNLAFLWNLWWVRTALATSDSIYQTSMIFYPYGTSLVLHTHTFLSGLVSTLLLPGVPVVTAQNVILLVSMALNGIAAYALALWLTRQTGAALVAGVYFLLCPFVAAHLLGHFNLVPVWMLPLFALSWLMALRTRSSLAALASGGVFALTVWNDYYLATYLVVFGSLTLVCRWWTICWSVRRTPAGTLDRSIVVACVLLISTVLAIRITGGGIFVVSGVRVSATTGLPLLTIAWALGLALLWRRWRPIPSAARVPDATVARDVQVAAVTAAVALLGALPLLLEGVGRWLGGTFPAPPSSLRSATAGIDIVGPVAGNPFHPLWGELVRRLYDRASIDIVESTGYIGIVAVLGVLLTRRPGLPVHASARVWKVTAGVFLIWALGPYLRVFGENSGLYLPAALLQIIPVLQNVRIPGRAMVMVYLALAVLLAYAIAATPPRLRRGIAGAALLLMVVDSAWSQPLTRLDRPALYQQLAELPDGAVLELPLGIRDGFGERGRLDHRVLFYQSIHGKPIAGGFVARMSGDLADAYTHSPLLGPLLQLSEGLTLPRDEAASLERNGPSLLRSDGFRYVVLASGVPPALQEVVDAWALAPVGADDERTLFRVTEP